MKELNLAPCPFCGGEAMFQAVKTDAAALTARIHYVVKCRNCKTTLGSYYTDITLRQNGTFAFYHDDRERAAAVWNQRYVTKEEKE